MHYWDTADPETREKQCRAYRAQLARFEATRAEAAAAGRGWQEKNMTRRIRDMAELIAVLEGPRGGHGAYLRYVTARAGPDTRVVGDITPAYGLLDEAGLAALAASHPRARLIYLMRDPLARLWSAVRMQARRQLQEGQTVERKANATLWRILHKGHETHLTDRGDYAGTLARLEATVPRERVYLAAMEDLVQDAGYEALCRWLGLPEAPVPREEKIHAGPQIAMREDLRPKALALLAPQYAAGIRALGHRPGAWEPDWAGTKAPS